MKRKRAYSVGPSTRKRRLITAPPRSYARPSFPEKKGMDTELAVNPVLATTNTNGAAFVLNLVQQGTGSWNRVGRKIYMTSARLRGQFTHFSAPNSETAGYEGNYVRMVVVYDKQPSGGAIPSFDTVFGTTDQSGSETTDILDPIKYDNMSRFRVLRDTVLTSNVTAAPETAGSQWIAHYPFDEYIKLGKMETVFSGQSDPMTIADISTGALYVYFRADIQTATDFMLVAQTAKSRLRYFD